jgi:hypothetical protein
MAMSRVGGATSHLIEKIVLISAGLFRSAMGAWFAGFSRIFSKSKA